MFFPDMNPLPTMLRDFAKRALQWADVLEKEEQEEGTLKPLITLLETPSERSERGPFAVRPTPPSSVVEVPPGFRTGYELYQDLIEKETGLQSGKDGQPVAAGPLGQEAAMETHHPVAPVAVPAMSHPTPTASTRSVPWRRGDYFFCESCGQRKQWFRNTAPWRGAICAPCYNAELARIEAARGRKA